MFEARRHRRTARTNGNESDRRSRNRCAGPVAFHEPRTGVQTPEAHMTTDSTTESRPGRPEPLNEARSQGERPMAIKIDQKDHRLRNRVSRRGPHRPAAPPPRRTSSRCTRRIERRPKCCSARPYKIRTPLSDHGPLRDDHNDVVLNAGTEHEQRRPFEIFINSKNMEHFQWIVALTANRVRGVSQGR